MATVAALGFGLLPPVAYGQNAPTRKFEIKEVTHRFAASALNIGASSANFEIAAHAGADIVVIVSGTPKMVDTVRFRHGARGVMVRDRTLEAGTVSAGHVRVEASGPGARAEVTIGGQTITARGDKIDIAIGPPPLRMRIKLPRDAALVLSDASGDVLISGMRGVQKITISGNGELSGNKLAGRMTLSATNNASAHLRDADFSEMRIAASDNASVEFSGKAAAVRLSAGKNADIEIKGDVTVVSKKISENASIDID